MGSKQPKKSIEAKKRTKAGTTKAGTEKEAGGERDALQAELKKLLKAIDAEGLRFLIRQAGVLIHNQQIEKVNSEIDKLNTLQKKLQVRAGSQSTSQNTEKSGAAAGAVPGVVDKRVLDVEEGEGSTFVLVLGSNRKMLSRDEMGSLVRISHLSESKTDGAARIYNWLARNRQDIIYDLRIKSKQDARLAELSNLLQKRYKNKS